MSQKVLIVGEQDNSSLPEDHLKTFALGSCIGIVLLDPSTRTVGMLHAALPDSSVSPDKAAKKPAYFVDTGIDLLLEEMSTAGCPRSGQGMVCKLAGGAAVLGQSDLFNVGKRNIEAAKKICREKGIKIVSEDTGKNISRTAEVNVGSAKLVLSSPGRENWVI